MKMIIKVAAIFLWAAFGLSAQAQRIKLVDGDLSPLKGESAVNLDFTYDNMRVGRYDKEQDYVNDKKEAYNKKEAGRGDSWAIAWVNDREARFEPGFIELFEKYSDFKVSSKKEAKYTLVFHTMATEPGFNIGITSKPSDIDAELLLVETADKTKVLAKLSVDNIKGRSFAGYDFDTGLRITEAYQLAGKVIGKFIMDKVK